MKAKFVVAAAGLLVPLFFLQCAASRQETTDPFELASSELDRGEDIMLFAELSLRQLKGCLNDARSMAVASAYDPVQGGGGCGPYLAALNRALEAVRDSTYGGIPVLDSSNTAWPGAIRLALGGNDAVSLLLPAVDSVVTGVISLKEPCLRQERDAGCLGEDCGHRIRAGLVPFGDHIEKIDDMMENVDVELGKMKIIAGRIAFERKLLSAAKAGEAIEPIVRETEESYESALQALKAAMNRNEQRLLSFEVDMLKQELDRVRSHCHPDRDMRCSSDPGTKGGAEGQP